MAKAKLAPKILVDDFHANLRRRLIEGAAHDLGDWLLDQTTLDNLLIDFDVSDGEVRS